MRPPARGDDEPFDVHRDLFEGARQQVPFLEIGRDQRMHLARISARGASKQNPPNGYAAKFSIPYAIAVGMLRGDAGLSEYEEAVVQDPAVRALASKVRYVIDPGNPIDRRPNTLAIRYGDPEWKNFLDFYGRFLTVNGEVERLLKVHVEKLGGA